MTTPSLKKPKRIVENTSQLITRFGNPAVVLATKLLRGALADIFEDVNLGDFQDIEDVKNSFEENVEVANELSKSLNLETKLKLAIYEEEEVNESSTPSSWSDLEEDITIAASLGLKIVASEMIEDVLYSLINFMRVNHLRWEGLSDTEWEGWDEQGKVTKEKIHLGEHWYYDRKEPLNAELDEDFFDTEMFIYEDSNLKLRLFFLLNQS